MFFYSLGNLFPLFILSIFYDKFNLANTKFIKGKIFIISIGNKEYEIHSTNLISGILFIVLGLVIIIYQGTTIVNTWDIFNTKNYFFTFQEKLISWDYANLLGIIIFFGFIISLRLFLWKRRRSKTVE